MTKLLAAVCAALLVISFSDNCFSLKSDDEDLVTGQRDYEPVSFIATEVNKEEVKEDVKTDSSENTDGLLRRITRQAYNGNSQLYPNIPSGPPYGQQPYQPYNPSGPYGPQQPTPWQPGQHNYNNPYGFNPQNSTTQPRYPSANGYIPSNFTTNLPPSPLQPNGQPTYNNPYGSNTNLAHNNYTQPGYPSANGYKPSNYSGSYGQNNGQPNYNNPYGSNTFGQNNYTQPGYPNSNGYKPSNFSSNPLGPYGQSPPPNSWHNPQNGQRPYNSSTSGPYPGFKPANSYNPSGRPPYYQPGQQQNNTYNGYPSYTTTPKPYSQYPNQRPSLYPGQVQNNTRPGYQHSVIYDDSTNRPGQNPYNSFNSTGWSGTTLNSTGRYNPQNGQHPQNSNTFTGFGYPQYGQQNSTNQYPYNGQSRPTYQNPSPYSPNNYPGQSSDAATFNLTNRFNPNIPVRPPQGSPYGNGPQNNGPYNSGSYGPYNSGPYNNGPYGNVPQNGTDPTRVSPHHFNSY